MSENETTGDGSNQNAISLFGQSANMNDFPVLKAFQEYIDAEQAKARKRMLGLSIFFIVLLVAVVITFTIIMTSIFAHNRELSDRLLDIAFRERNAAVAAQQPAPAPQPIVVPQPVVTPSVTPAQDAGMKSLLEKLETLATAMAARQQQSVAPAPVVVTTTAPAPVQPALVAESAETLQMRETLKKQQAELEAERARVKAAEEKLRQAEIERHRRRLYPEYYAQQDAADTRQQEQPLQPPPSAQTIVPVQQIVPVKPAPVQPVATAPVVPVQPVVQQPAPEQKPAKHAASAQPAAAAAPQPKPKVSVPTSLKELKPIDYFAQSEPKDETKAPTPSKQPTPVQAAKKENNAKPIPTKQDPPRVETTPAPLPAPTAKPAQPAAKPTPSAKPAQQTAKPKQTTPTTAKQPPAKEQPKKQPPPPSAPKTETLNVGTTSDTSIPWLIEQQDL